jgi:hypothetical protein
MLQHSSRVVQSNPDRTGNDFSLSRDIADEVSVTAAEVVKLITVSNPAILNQMCCQSSSSVNIMPQ